MPSSRFRLQINDRTDCDRATGKLVRTLINLLCGPLRGSESARRAVYRRISRSREINLHRTRGASLNGVGSPTAGYDAATFNLDGQSVIPQSGPTSKEE